MYISRGSRGLTSPPPPPQISDLKDHLWRKVTPVLSGLQLAHVHVATDGPTAAPATRYQKHLERGKCALRPVPT